MVGFEGMDESGETKKVKKRMRGSPSSDRNMSDFQVGYPSCFHH